jgi:hypothetical protein
MNRIPKMYMSDTMRSGLVKELQKKCRAFCFLGVNEPSQLKVYRRIFHILYGLLEISLPDERFGPLVTLIARDAYVSP